MYTVCTAIAGQGLPYSLSNIEAAGLPALAKGATDFACNADFIEISGSSEVCGVAVANKYCGDVLTTDVVTPGFLNNPICGKVSCYCLVKKCSTDQRIILK